MMRSPLSETFVIPAVRHLRLQVVSNDRRARSGPIEVALAELGCEPAGNGDHDLSLIENRGTVHLADRSGDGLLIAGRVDGLEIAGLLVAIDDRPMPEIPLDVQVLGAMRLQIGPDAVGALDNQLKEDLRVIRDGLGHGDDQIRRHAHALSAIAGTIGAAEIRVLARALRAAVVRHDPHSADLLAAATRRWLVALLAWLDRDELARRAEA